MERRPARELAQQGFRVERPDARSLARDGLVAFVNPLPGQDDAVEDVTWRPLQRVNDPGRGMETHLAYYKRSVVNEPDADRWDQAPVSERRAVKGVHLGHFSTSTWALVGPTVSLSISAR